MSGLEGDRSPMKTLPEVCNEHDEAIITTSANIWRYRCMKEEGLPPVDGGGRGIKERNEIRGRAERNQLRAAWRLSGCAT
jgi:hypothetical protein